MSYLDELLNIFSFANLNSSNRDVKRGNAFSQTDIGKMQFDVAAAREERAWQQDMYERYQSVPAQVRQMQESGINPSLMYQGAPSAGNMSSSGTDVSAPDTSNNPTAGLDIAQSIISMLTGTASVGSQVGDAVGRTKQSLTQASVNRATEANVREDTLLKEQQRLNLVTENQIKEIEKTFKSAKEFLSLEKTKSEVSRNFQDIKESASRISLNDSNIDVNGHKIALMFKLGSKFDSEIALNAARTTLTNLDSAKAAAMLPFVEKFAYADLNLRAAQTSNLQGNTHLAYSESAVALADAAYKNGLLDKGQLDLVIEGMKIDNKAKDAQRKVAIANAVVGNICNIVNAGCNVAGTVMTAGLSQVAQPVVNGATGQPLVTPTGVPIFH